MRKNYTINEVAKIFNITTNKIRFYEKKGLLKPFRDKENQYRKFSQEDIIRLQAILLYRSVGLSIEDIIDISDNSSNNNFLNQFNKQWKVVNDEIHRLINIRESIEVIIDSLYESDGIDVDNTILKIIEDGDKINKVKDNWIDKWDFNHWANSYDKDVKKDNGKLKIYKNYENILEKVCDLVKASGRGNEYVLEIGVGTGNLAGKLLNNNYNIIGIDQSREMLNISKQKYPKLKVRLGEFLKIPYNDKCFNIIVSTYAFHHLNSDEKSIAIGEMIRVLKDDGKIIIGDLMFKDKKDEEKILKSLSNEQIAEIKDEYYSYIDELENEFLKFNKKLKYTKVDDFIYIVEVE